LQDIQSAFWCGKKFCNFEQVGKVLAAEHILEPVVDAVCECVVAALDKPACKPEQVQHKS